jgi:hypothetical protein
MKNVLTLFCAAVLLSSCSAPDKETATDNATIQGTDPVKRGE